jgi:hypothetical protein
METYNNMYPNPNAKPLFHIFELEEMLEKSGNIYCLDKLQGPSIPLQDSKMFNTHEICWAIKMMFNNF